MKLTVSWEHVRGDEGFINVLVDGVKYGKIGVAGTISFEVPDNSKLIHVQIRGLWKSVPIELPQGKEHVVLRCGQRSMLPGVSYTSTILSTITKPGSAYVMVIDSAY